MLSKITGNKMKEIHRRSYRIPIKKEGMVSPNEIFFGLKAMKVASLNNVNIRRKMTRRFVTHNIVLGILNLDSIITAYLLHSNNYKRIEFNRIQQMDMAA
ncbi:MAG: hypothetical protein H7Y01_06270 [Ferruginibacter sp.]|nr:hypothetical protein [Chitinophagaceae bacterium]